MATLQLCALSDLRQIRILVWPSYPPWASRDQPEFERTILAHFFFQAVERYVVDVCLHDLYFPAQTLHQYGEKDGG
jgi:hypothetical protein